MRNQVQQIEQDHVAAQREDALHGGMYRFVHCLQEPLRGLFRREKPGGAASWLCLAVYLTCGQVFGMARCRQPLDGKAFRDGLVLRNGKAFEAMQSGPLAGDKVFRAARERNPVFLRQIPERRVAQRKAVQKGNPIHAEQIRQHKLPPQKGQNEAAEIHRADIVAECQEELGLPFADHLPCIQIGHHPCPHGEAAEESHQHGIAYVSAYFI